MIISPRLYPSASRRRSLVLDPFFASFIPILHPKAAIFTVKLPFIPVKPPFLQGKQLPFLRPVPRHKNIGHPEDAGARRRPDADDPMFAEGDTTFGFIMWDPQTVWGGS